MPSVLKSLAGRKKRGPDWVPPTSITPVQMKDLQVGDIVMSNDVQNPSEMYEITGVSAVASVASDDVRIELQVKPRAFGLQNSNNTVRVSPTAAVRVKRRV